MSKIALKRELKNFTKEQLIELIIELYEVNNEVKEYFKFYLNPDSKLLREKYFDKILKEIRRKSYRGSKARISIIKKELNRFDSLSPDITERINLYINVLAALTNQGKYVPYTDTQKNGTVWVMNKLVEIFRKEDRLDEGINTVNTIIDNPKLCSKAFSDYLVAELNMYLDSNKLISSSK